MTAADLRQVGYVVDDVTTPGTWMVSGLGQSWTFPADDAATARDVYELALNASNVSLRTQAENAVAQLTAALESWDALTVDEVKAATKLGIQVTVNLVRLTVNRYGG